MHSYSLYLALQIDYDFLIIGAFPPHVESKTGSVFVTPKNQNQTVNIGQTAEVFEGRPLTIHCPVKGVPKPEVSWKFQGKDIKYVTGVNMMVDKSGGGLMIVEVNKRIAGKISCTAKSVLGSSSATSLIKIRGELLGMHIQFFPIVFVTSISLLLQRD